MLVKRGGSRGGVNKGQLQPKLIFYCPTPPTPLGVQTHAGRGWSAQITRVKHNACLVKWIAKEGNWHGWHDYYQLQVVMGWEPLK